MRLDAAGAITRGDPDRSADAAGYGVPVLAVADALVTAVRDDIADSVSIKPNTVLQFED